MVKVLVVGGGRIALSHLPIIIANSNVELVGIVEPSFSTRFVLKNLFDSKIYKSIEYVSVDFDVVYILTPNKTHYSLSKRFLEIGKHVFLEKPLSTSAGESLELYNLAHRKGVILQCGYVNRFLDTFIEARSLLKSGYIGKLNFARNEMRGNVVKANQISTWRTSGVGAGCLYDYGPHAIDIGLFLLGDYTEVIHSEIGSVYSINSNDWFKASIRHSCGVLQEIICDWADSSVRKAENVVEVSGTKGSLLVSKSILKVTDLDGKTLVDKRANDFKTDVDFYLRGEEFSRQTATFIQAAAGLEGEHPYPDSYIKDALSVDKIIEQVYVGKK